MDDEGVLGAIDLRGQLPLFGIELAFVGIERGAQIAVRAVLHCQLIGPASPHCDFDPFHRVEHQQAQCTVEFIERDNVFKGGAGLESRAGLPLGMFKIEPVGAQPVIADMLEAMLRQRGIGDHHAFALQLGDLLREGQRRFGERDLGGQGGGQRGNGWRRHQMRPASGSNLCGIRAKKVPPGAHAEAEAWEALLSAR